jgi:exopolyphosphatase/guanosine-5'-triphosphate,3'-diphosphate pyrophosphatase
MRRAVIDLGTNTFNLLIADTQTRQVLFQTKEGVALGMGGINEKRLSPAAIQRAFEALQKFKDKCDALEVNAIRAIGTSAMRDATNANELIEKVATELKISIEVISGLQEAELIYKGVALSHIFDEPALIMDIGGGSTEFIVADLKGPILAHSFDIGVSRLFQLFDYQDPLSIQDIERVENYLNQHCAHFFKQQLPKVLIGASGSFETFYELMAQAVFDPQGAAVQVDASEFKFMLDQIIASTQAERNANPHIIEIRKRMAPLAAIKTRWVLKIAQIEHIYISPYSLKEGALFGL